ncbi:hypothetical protein [Thiocystis violascens]|uniref:Uncharacterized protein n=1 Tax=Thiocystis violascens (strain ATCC 17096 / DSM 198 / 6111) TaxID=765911 RepID=I3Y9A2_THIV6|nr:hypothetical protein [Thiocystis violascens]AFL73570.1 hypothetical protein Thivi_1582 [Thiocystis violascens DSM 198]
MKSRNPLSVAVEDLLAHNGWAPLDPNALYQLFPGRWATRTDAQMQWSRDGERLVADVRERGAQMLSVTLKGQSLPILLATHSTARLSERMGWLGLSVAEIVTEGEQSAQDAAENEPVPLTPEQIGERLDAALAQIRAPETLKRVGILATARDRRRWQWDAEHDQIRDLVASARLDAVALDRLEDWRATVATLPAEQIEVTVKGDRTCIEIADLAPKEPRFRGPMNAA